MHLSFNAIAFLALVPLLTVTAAPVNKTEAGDNQKGDVEDPTHMPLEPKYGGYPMYEEYSPPNPERRSVAASEVEKRFVVPEPNPGDQEPPNGPTVFAYEDYIPIHNPEKRSTSTSPEIEKREPPKGPGGPTVFAYQEYGSRPDVEKRSAIASPEAEKREAAPGPGAQEPGEPKFGNYHRYGPPPPDVEKREASAEWPGPPKFEDYERYLPSPDVQKSKRQDGGTPTYADYPKPIAVAAYAPKICDPDGGVCYNGYDGGVKNIQKNKRNDPTPIRFDPYATPHCDPSGLCDVRYGGDGGGKPPPSIEPSEPVEPDEPEEPEEPERKSKRDGQDAPLPKPIAYYNP